MAVTWLIDFSRKPLIRRPTLQGSGRLGQSMFLRGAGTGILDTQFSIMQDRLAERRMKPLLPWLPQARSTQSSQKASVHLKRPGVGLAGQTESLCKSERKKNLLTPLLLPEEAGYPYIFDCCVTLNESL